MKGKLYLLPNLLEETLPIEPFLPISVTQAIHSLEGLIAESEKTARRYLRKFVSHEKMNQIPLRLLNEHTESIQELIEPIEQGQTWGLISDAGLPCIADPGADLVWLAHQKKIEVIPFVGPCSLILALQLSGFHAQQFTFHGYLPREIKELEMSLQEMEKRKGTHLWIEAPYRSFKMLEVLKKSLEPSTKLCVATHLTTPSQRVLSQTIAKWRQTSFPLEKEPAVFVIRSESI